MSLLLRMSGNYLVAFAQRRMQADVRHFLVLALMGGHRWLSLHQQIVLLAQQLVLRTQCLVYVHSRGIRCGLALDWSHGLNARSLLASRRSGKAQFCEPWAVGSCLSTKACIDVA